MIIIHCRSWGNKTAKTCVLTGGTQEKKNSPTSRGLVFLVLSLCSLISPSKPLIRVGLRPACDREGVWGSKNEGPTACGGQVRVTRLHTGALSTSPRCPWREERGWEKTEGRNDQVMTWWPWSDEGWPWVGTPETGQVRKGETFGRENKNTWWNYLTIGVFHGRATAVRMFMSPMSHNICYWWHRKIQTLGPLTRRRHQWLNNY